MSQKSRSRYGAMLAIIVAATLGGGQSVYADNAPVELSELVNSSVATADTRAKVLDLLNTNQASSQVFLQGLSMGLPLDQVLEMMQGAQTVGVVDAAVQEPVYSTSSAGSKVASAYTVSSSSEGVGRLFYSEPSDETRAEILSLLNSKTSTKDVFLQGLSMGLPLDGLLEASIRNNQDKGQHYFNTANSLLSTVGYNSITSYPSYSVSDLGGDATASAVIDRFFSKGMKLSGTPDWQVGEYHMMVSASELQSLSNQYNDGNYWYLTDENTQPASASRPVFIQLYSEHDYAIINDAAKISSLNATNPAAKLPVVFVFNDIRERPVSQMTQPVTLQNVIEDYRQYNLMVTAPPEWSSREYHAKVPVSSLESYFTLPSEQDVPAETWASLTSQISSQGLNESFLISVIDNGEAILNRADKLAVAKYMGYSEVPVSYYYVDGRRVSPYKKGYRGLQTTAASAGYATGMTSGSVGVLPSNKGTGGIGERKVVVVTPPPPPPPPTTTCPSEPCTSL